MDSIDIPAEVQQNKEDSDLPNILIEDDDKIILENDIKMKKKRSNSL